MQILIKNTQCKVAFSKDSLHWEWKYDMAEKCEHLC